MLVRSAVRRKHDSGLDIMSATCYKKHRAPVCHASRTVERSCSRRACLSTTAWAYTLLAALYPAPIRLRPTTLLPDAATEARSATLRSPAALMVQPSRFAALPFQRRDYHGTSRRWREARRPSPSPHHEHTARRRNPKSGTRAAIERRRQTRALHTLARAACAKCAFPTLGIWRVGNVTRCLHSKVISYWG